MLTDGIIKILPLEERHLEPLRKLRNDPQTWRYLTSVLPIKPQSQINWFAQLSTDKTRMYFAIEKKAKFVGILRSDEYDMVNQSIRIGADVVSKYRRQGIALKVYRLFLDYLFNQLNIHRVWLLVAEFNQPAITLYQKIGFQKEGSQRKALFRDGKWSDYLMMSLLREEYQKSTR